MDIRDGNLTASYKCSLVIDAMGLLSSVAAVKPRAPAEKSLYPHLLWLRDLLIKQILNSISWTDTRDMGPMVLLKGRLIGQHCWSSPRESSRSHSLATQFSLHQEVRQ